MARHLPGIDGLRAFAVLAVVAYHAGLPVGAGYVGVDVFFVISGYVITRMLLAEPKIDLLEFYARRVRRILPALIVVVASVVALSALLLAGGPQTAVNRSAMAALAMVPNFYFQMSTGGYFDAASDEMPLLHLWSLGVEEQFYLLWPLLLIAFRRRPWVLAAFAMASFALAQYWVHANAEAAFYQMPARFWELAVGAFVAMAPASRFLPVWVGLAGLVTGVLVPTQDFPGLGAVLPVVATALVLHALHGGARNALLEWRPVRYVGLVSYSFYLWHWPLLALYAATDGGDPRTKLVLCTIAFGLACVSHRYIEQPFRRLAAPGGRTVAAGIASCLALAACGYGLSTKQPQDHPVAAQAERDIPDRSCLHYPQDAFPKCPSQAPVAVWGDSMAHSWTPAFPGARNYTMSSCAPFMGYLPGARKADHACLQFNAQVSRQLQGIDTLVLVALWRTDAMHLRPTLEATRHIRRVVLVGPTPTMRHAVPKCFRQALPCAQSRAEFDARAKPILAALREQASGYPNVVVMDVTDRFCTATECPPLRKGIPLYTDRYHLTRSAAAAFSAPGSQRMSGTP